MLGEVRDPGFPRQPGSQGNLGGVEGSGGWAGSGVSVAWGFLGYPVPREIRGGLAVELKRGDGNDVDCGIPPVPGL